MKLPKVLCVLGPTSSGKTVLGIALAKRFFGEVINGDARQLYADAPIGTGVPVNELVLKQGVPVRLVQGVPHHLLAVSAPHEIWTVSRWCSEATAYIRHLEQEERLPIVVGGTGLYIRALTEGYVFEGEPNPVVRQRLLLLHPHERVERLVQHAPEARERIDLRNPHRVLRALERVMSGQSLTAVQVPPSFDVCKVALQRSSEELRARIEQTIHEQLERGWVEEVRQLLERGVSPSSPLMQSIGFRAIASALQADEVDRDLLEREIVRDTWAYARRQVTWLRKEPRLQWVTGEDEAHSLVERWLKR